MHSLALPTLTVDEIDDLLYFTRVNEVQELEQTISSLTQRYSCQSHDILQASVDPDSGNTVLHYCSANGFTDLLAKLLDQLRIHSSAGFIDHENKQGSTPLHWAALNGHLPCVKLLVEAGANLWRKNAAGHHAMFEAGRAEKDDVVQYLLATGGTKVEETEGGQSEEIEDGADAVAGEEIGAKSNGDTMDVETGAPHD